MSIRKKILVPMIVLTVICSAAVLVSSILLYSRDLNAAVDEKIDVALMTAEREINIMMTKSHMMAVIVAESRSLMYAIKTRDRAEVLAVVQDLFTIVDIDFCNILDNEGTVLVRTHEPGRYGDNIAWQHSVAAALAGRTESVIEGGAIIPLSVRAGAPIRDDDGEILGVVMLGFRLDTPDFVNRVKEITGCEAAIFLGSECISTTIIDENGISVVGTRATGNVAEQVLAGGTFVGRKEVLGRDAAAAYSPLHGHGGGVIGMMFVGRYTDDDTARLLYFILGGALITLVTLAVVTVIATVVSKTIDRRQDEMVKALREADERTRLEYIRLNLVIESAKIGMWDMEVIKLNDLLDAENPFTWSKEFRSLLGFDNTSDFPDVLGSFTERLHPEDKDKVLAEFKAHMMDKTGATPYDKEFRAKMKDGVYRYFHSTGVAIRDENGAPVHVLGITTDITETKNTIIETEKLREQAEAANKAKSTFLANMSHEIRTPMNAILGITEILMQAEALPKGVAEGLSRIHNSSDLLMGIINDILDFSKIEAGKLDIITDEYSVANLINDSANLNMMRIGSKRIEFELQIDENIPAKLIGDEMRIKQILNNLLSNAFKYTDAGKVTLKAAAEPAAGAPYITLVFEVRDTGMGMTKEQMDKLFEEYSRFHQEGPKKIEGTGLGMAITQSLIRLMDGEIFAESEVGKGSVFIVRLRQEVVDDEVLGSEAAENLRKFRLGYMAAHKRTSVIREPMPYGRVLVVDDVETNLYVAAGLMRPYELNVETVLGGFEALAKAEAGHVYDIVFMDHMMPNMDGIETTKRLRALGYTAPIVALTANAVSGQADMFMQNGFDAFISKPVDIRQLDVVLNKFIRDKQSLMTLESARKQVAKTPQPAADDVLAESLASANIEGLGTAKGVNKFGDAAVYLEILRSYASNTRAALKTAASYDAENPHPYTVAVHGIRGSSYNVFADSAGKEAKGLEEAAKAGNTAYIMEHNAGFIDMMTKLLDEIDLLLSTVDSKEGPKPVKSTPDAALLRRLREACEMYDMDAAETAMKEINEYAYNADDGLVSWLQSNMDVMDYAGIVERLSQVSSPK